MDTLSSNEQLSPFLKPVRVTECYLGKGSTSARIMNYILWEQKRALEQDTEFVTGSAKIQGLQKLKMIKVIFTWSPPF